MGITVSLRSADFFLKLFGEETQPDPLAASRLRRTAQVNQLDQLFATLPSSIFYGPFK